MTLIRILSVMMMIGFGVVGAVDAQTDVLELRRSFMEMIESDDDLLIEYAIEEGLSQSDPVIRREAMRKAIVSGNPDFFAQAVAGILNTGSVFLITADPRVSGRDEDFLKMGIPASIKLRDNSQFNIQGGELLFTPMSPSSSAWFNCSISAAKLNCLDTQRFLSLKHDGEGNLSGFYRFSWSNGQGVQSIQVPVQLTLF